MMTTAETTKTVQVYRVYIKATPQAIWDAITKPEWTENTATLRWSITTCEPEARSGRTRTRE